MALRRKVHDGVYFPALENVVQQVDRKNVPLDELDVEQMSNTVQIFQTGTVVKFIEYDYLYVTNHTLVSQLQP